MTKLTAEMALAIVSDPRFEREIAASFGVAKATVNAIRSGRTWSLVTGKRDPRLQPPRVRTKASDRTCTVPACVKPQASSGLCHGHYWRSRREGDLPLTEKKQRKAGEGVKFAAAALLIETNDCIDWPFANIKGYGTFTFRGKGHRAHAWVCEQAHGPRPFPGAHAAHSCGRRICINKRHVRWASPLENIHDKELHGRQTKGEAINTAVLTESQVLAIANDNRPFTEIAEAYGCGRSTIRAIHKGESWRAVTGIDPNTAATRLHRHKFSAAEVERIKSDPRSCKIVAQEFGCSHSTINEIRRGLRRYA